MIKKFGVFALSVGLVSLLGACDKDEYNKNVEPVVKEESKVKVELPKTQTIEDIDVSKVESTLTIAGTVNGIIDPTSAEIDIMGEITVVYGTYEQIEEIGKLVGKEAYIEYIPKEDGQNIISQFEEFKGGSPSWNGGSPDETDDASEVNSELEAQGDSNNQVNYADDSNDTNDTISSEVDPDTPVSSEIVNNNTDSSLQTKCGDFDNTETADSQKEYSIDCNE